jgi:hypothetical protein
LQEHRHISAPSTLYRNDSATCNWIKIRLKGISSESNAISSKIEVESERKKIIHEIDGGRSSHISQNAVIAHFGLGKTTKIDRITVCRTGGNKQSFSEAVINQLITTTEIPEKKSNTTYLFLLVGPGLVILAFIIL